MFLHKETVTEIFRPKLNFTEKKTAKSGFVPPFGIISANSIFLASSYSCGTIERNLSKSAFSEGVGHFERNFW